MSCSSSESDSPLEGGDDDDDDYNSEEYQEDQEDTGPTCNLSHDLVLSDYAEGGYENGWNCNRCGQAGLGERFLCLPCTYDCCVECFQDSNPDYIHDIPPQASLTLSSTTTVSSSSSPAHSLSSFFPSDLAAVLKVSEEDMKAQSEIVQALLSSSAPQTQSTTTQPLTFPFPKPNPFAPSPAPSSSNSTVFSSASSLSFFAKKDSAPVAIGGTPAAATSSPFVLSASSTSAPGGLFSAPPLGSSDQRNLPTGTGTDSFLRSLSSSSSSGGSSSAGSTTASATSIFTSSTKGKELGGFPLGRKQVECNYEVLVAVCDLLEALPLAGIPLLVGSSVLYEDETRGKLICYGVLENQMSSEQYAIRHKDEKTRFEKIYVVKKANIRYFPFDVRIGRPVHEFKNLIQLLKQLKLKLRINSRDESNFYAGDSVILSDNYASISDANSGPLKPGQVGFIEDCTPGGGSGKGSYRIKTSSGKTYNYNREALVKTSKKFEPDPNLLMVNEAVILSDNYASIADAKSGPLKPGEVGLVESTSNSGVSANYRIRTPDGRTYSYKRDALVRTSRKYEPLKYAFAVGHSVVLASGDRAGGPLSCGDVGCVCEVIDVNKYKVRSPKGKLHIYNKEYLVKTNLKFEPNYRQDKDSEWAIGDSVILSENYESVQDASSGPLKPFEVASIIRVNHSTSFNISTATGRTWNYAKDALLKIFMDDNDNDDEFSSIFGQGGKRALGLDSEGATIVASTAIPLKLYFDVGKTQEVYFTSSTRFDNDTSSKSSTSSSNNNNNNSNSNNNNNNSSNSNTTTYNMDVVDLEDLKPTSEFESYLSLARFSNRSHKNIVMF